MIIGLDTFKTTQAFADLSNLTTNEVKQKFESSSFFLDYEKGKISDPEFRAMIRSLLKINATDSEIDRAWNAMLLDFHPEKLKLLQEMKTEYKTYLLSNTNSIHLEEVNQILHKSTGFKSLDFYFHKSYYSHLLGMRKPDQEIFKHVIIENNLNPADTIFLDDNESNLSGAISLGIQTQLITPTVTILSLFS